MRIAIAYALHHPDLMDLPTKRLRLEEVGTLEFEPSTTTRSRACAWRWRPPRPAAPRRAC